MFCGSVTQLQKSTVSVCMAGGLSERMQPAAGNTEAQTTQLHGCFCNTSGAIASLRPSSLTKRGPPAHTPVSAWAEGKCQPSLAPDDVYSHSSKAAPPSFVPTPPTYPAVEQLATCLSL